MGTRRLNAAPWATVGLRGVILSDPDAQLVQAILEGDTALFADVIRRHDAQVRAIVERRIRDADSRDEIVQHTFWLAFRKLSVLTDRSKLAAWLARIARNAVSEFRRRRRAAPAPLGEHLASDRAPVAGWIWEEVAQLSPLAREALELRYRHGLSYAEIADLLQVRRSTVRGRIYQARRELRQRLAGEKD
jgi:RNA polymerase sigma-70 factor (ECF subfamily)